MFPFGALCAFVKKRSANWRFAATNSLGREPWTAPQVSPLSAPAHLGMRLPYRADEATHTGLRSDGRKLFSGGHSFPHLGTAVVPPRGLAREPNRHGPSIVQRCNLEEVSLL